MCLSRFATIPCNDTAWLKNLESCACVACSSSGGGQLIVPTQEFDSINEFSLALKMLHHCTYITSSNQNHYTSLITYLGYMVQIGME